MIFTRLCASLLLLWACQPLFAQEATTAIAAKQFPAPLSRLELEDGDCIVFLGDSITHQRLYTQYVEDFFYTRFPHLRLKLHNAGVGGARAIDALDRFDKDVAAYRPKYVTILLGMNDGSYRAYDHEVLKTYQRDMTKLLDQIQELGGKAIPMTPSMFDTRALKLKSKDQAAIERMSLYNSVLAYYGGWLQEVAYERGLGFVDLYSPLNQITMEQRKTNPTFTLIEDAVHPGPDGHVVMAAAVIRGLGLGGPVSATKVTRGADGAWIGEIERGKLDEIQATGSGSDFRLSFHVTADSLPWVLPANAQLGVRLTYLGHSYSRESLQVNGLPPGRYRLTIDGVDVGTFSDQELAGVIELQENQKTPQYQQALKVAELNKQRNEGPIGKLRAEWLKFQQYARIKRSEVKNADLAKLEEEMKGLDERVAAANAEAKAIEDQIYEVNQPRSRKYELTPVP